MAIDIFCQYGIKNEEAEELLQKCKTALDDDKNIPLEDMIANVSSRGNLCGTVKKWAKNNIVDDKALVAIKDKVLLMNLRNIPRDMNSKRKDFVKAIGEENTAKLFTLINL